MLTAESTPRHTLSVHGAQKNCRFKGPIEWAHAICKYAFAILKCANAPLELTPMSSAPSHSPRQKFIMASKDTNDQAPTATPRDIESASKKSTDTSPHEPAPTSPEHETVMSKGQVVLVLTVLFMTIFLVALDRTIISTVRSMKHCSLQNLSV